MTDTNASFPSGLRSDELRAQIGKLEGLDHRTPVQPNLEAFDAETEALLGRLYGETHRYVEAYKYAALAEAEAMVNLPESAQEPMAKDLPKTALQQRRQVLLGILTEIQDDMKDSALHLADSRKGPSSV